MSQPRTMAEAVAQTNQRTMRRTDLTQAMVSTPHRQKAQELRAAFNQAIDGVRKDDGLSTKGKSQLIARAYRNVEAELRRLGAEDWKVQVAQHDKLETKLFGGSASSPESALSFRDAASRANELKGAADAKVALGSARLSGDTTMAKAIALRAWNAGWQDVVDDYAVNAHPSVGDEIAELTAVRDNLNSLTERFGGNMTFGGLTRPEELRGRYGSQLDELADADPQPSREGLKAMHIALGNHYTFHGNVGAPSFQELEAYSNGVKAELAEVGE